jgi:hypothetical protein
VLAPTAPTDVPPAPSAAPGEAAAPALISIFGGRRPPTGRGVASQPSDSTREAEAVAPRAAKAEEATQSEAEKEMSFKTAAAKAAAEVSVGRVSGGSPGAVLELPIP